MLLKTNSSVNPVVITEDCGCMSVLSLSLCSVIITFTVITMPLHMNFIPYISGLVFVLIFVHHEHITAIPYSLRSQGELWRLLLKRVKISSHFGLFVVNLQSWTWCFIVSHSLTLIKTRASTSSIFDTQWTNELNEFQSVVRLCLHFIVLCLKCLGTYHFVDLPTLN